MTTELGARLALVAELVRTTRCAADVGTDHGYLIVNLAQSGKIQTGFACDVRPMPLAKAARLIEQSGLSHRLTPVLADGLDGLPGEAVDDVVLAGMGGDLIAGIIGRTPWLRDERKHLVLQPMTHAEQLRRWLYEHGFEISEEHGVQEAGHRYCVLSVYYSGHLRSPSRLECLVGALGQSSRSASQDYLRHLASQLRRIAQEASHSNTKSNICEENYNLAQQIDEIAAQMSV